MSDAGNPQADLPTLSVVNEPAYYEALGRFVHAFSGVESMLMFALKTYAKVSWPVARAIFSGVRVEQSMDFVNRICDAFDPGDEWRKELEDVFTQLRAINEIRNSLLHLWLRHHERQRSHHYEHKNCARADENQRACRLS
jgi:hypothetical protein